MKFLLMAISAFLLAVQAQASYSYGKHNTSMAPASSTPPANLSTTSVFTPEISIVFTTVRPAHTMEPHVPMSRHQHSFSWSFNGTQTHHMPTGGTGTPCHSHSYTHTHTHSHSHSHNTSTRGTPQPTVTSTFPHVSLSSEGSNIPEGTGSDNGDQPTGEGGLLPVPLVHPTTTMSRHHHSHHSHHSTTLSTEAPAPTASVMLVTIPEYTGTLSWTTITHKPSTMTIPLSLASTPTLPPEGPPPMARSRVERAEDQAAAVMDRFSSGSTSTTSSATTWATSSPFTLHCDASICSTYCYCGQDGHVICDYDPASCANTCDCKSD